MRTSRRRCGAGFTLIESLMVRGRDYRPSCEHRDSQPFERPPKSPLFPMRVRFENARDAGHHVWKRSEPIPDIRGSVGCRRIHECRRRRFLGYSVAAFPLAAVRSGVGDVRWRAPAQQGGKRHGRVPGAVRLGHRTERLCGVFVGLRLLDRKMTPAWRTPRPFSGFFSS
jgi:hypothetical protein